MNPKSWVLSQAVGWFGGQWRSWPKCFGTKFADNARPKQAVQSSTKKSFKCLWRSFGLYKIVPKRPEMSSGCYKSQSFFFPKTSKNPIQAGNPKLNDTSFTPDEFARAKKIKSKCSQPKYFWEEKGLRLITAKLQFMVFQKYCSEKSEMHYWYITHDIKEISEKILKFQQCVPSQNPTNHPICCNLVFQCLCTEKKIQKFQWKFVKTLLINSFKLYSAEPYILIYTNIFKYICSEMCRNSFHSSDWRILRNILTGNFTTVKLEYWCKEQ